MIFKEITGNTRWQSHFSHYFGISICLEKMLIILFVEKNHFSWTYAGFEII